MSSGNYPGPVALRPFLKSYSDCDGFSIKCYSSASALENLKIEEDSGMVVVNYRGLAIVTYRSVVTYESALFGSPYRGYLILFHFTLVNGPMNCAVRLPRSIMLHDYTPEHMVSIEIQFPCRNHVLLGCGKI